MKVTRRKFLGGAAAVGAAAAVGYSAWEAREFQISHFTLPVKNLPAAFAGLRAAFLADLHHGPFFSREFIRSVVEQTNRLGVDVILLGGDYVYHEARYIPGVMEELGHLSAPLGVYGVPGNHDNRASVSVTSQEMARNGLKEITNTGIWLTRGNERFRICGVDDCQTGYPDLPAALADARMNEGVLLLTHNPDFSETVRDPRVSLVLCGHTHGGQVCLPYIGAPIVPSAYGQKYVYGLASAPDTKVFTTRGVGAIFPPVRWNCPAEIALLTFAPA